jgi:3-phenylpropionate/trans-cinnamate dioxygenase ferredoxin reductase subunit
MIREEMQPYNRIPYFWSDQYGKRIQYLGHALKYESTVLRGDLKDGKFTYFYLDKDDIIQAALVINEPKNIMPIRKFITRQNKVDKELLMNADIPLKQAVAGPSKSLA